MKLYNTLTRKVELLSPLEAGKVRMYTCGPTVYDFAHIGNFRTFVFQDVLRRYLRYKSYHLLHVMNITDVEDRIIENSAKEGVSIFEYAERYIRAFLQDMETLRIQRPDIMPKATDHIEEMTKLIERLQEKGLTYESDGSIYYRISLFNEYGKLSGVELDGDAQAGRVDSDSYTKENPRDFVLWKSKREGEHSWPTPFGEGRPGWHLECSAMSMKYLGESLDIHCGGVDLVFPHHENEIAQSEGATGRPFVRHWVHGAHLIVEGQKMSKSLGNFYTLRDLLDKGCSPAALRYLLSSVHYRSQLNFTFDGVHQAEASIQRVNDLLVRVREVDSKGPGDPEIAARVASARSDFEAAMDEDLNTSAALASLFELIRDANVWLHEGRLRGDNRRQVLEFVEGVNEVFDVFEIEEQELADTKIARLIQERQEARSRRDFERADEIRENLLSQGIVLEDTKEGTRWKKR